MKGMIIDNGSELIKDFMSKRNLTMKKMSQEGVISYSHLINIAKGTKPLTHMQAYYIMQKFGITDCKELGLTEEQYYECALEAREKSIVMQQPPSDVHPDVVAIVRMVSTLNRKQISFIRSFIGSYIEKG